MLGPAALSLTTAPPKAAGGRAPYDDGLDESGESFVYHYRTAQKNSVQAVQAADRDNGTLQAAARLAVPLIYFRGVGPGQYSAVAPIFLSRDDPARRLVEFQAALFIGDASQLAGSEAVALTDASVDIRRYATREALARLHQQRFRTIVLQAYGGRCAICSLRESALLQAAHILEDRDPRGVAAVINGIAMCAIHHLAYDRNLMGIDPDGVVHVTARLLKEQDGPMLKNGLQGFHGAAILQPKRPDERPDPERLGVRYEAFRAAA
jgi:putative restriction endonuclease